MNPNRNEFEKLTEKPGPEPKKLLRPDGTPVPGHWSIFRVGEEIVIKDYVFEVVYIGRRHMRLRAIGENKGGE